MKCVTCGLLDQDVKPYLCLRFNKEITEEDAGKDLGVDCFYHCKIKYEDGEQLTPKQHLILQDQEFRSKKMKGPF